MHSLRSGRTHGDPQPSSQNRSPSEVDNPTSKPRTTTTDLPDPNLPLPLARTPSDPSQPLFQDGPTHMSLGERGTSSHSVGDWDLTSVRTPASMTSSIRAVLANMEEQQRVAAEQMAHQQRLADERAARQEQLMQQLLGRLQS